MVTPTLTYVDKALVISWTAPNDNFSPISEYKIEFMAVDDVTWYQDQFDCDGSNPDILMSLQCTIPMLTLQEPPFNLVLGSPILARISATNVIGVSPPSVVNLPLTPVNTVPLQPTLPIRGVMTNTVQVDLRWEDLNADLRNGGSVITSYEVLWDSGTGGQVWTELTGYTVPLSTPYYLATFVTMGTRYKF